MCFLLLKIKQQNTEESIKQKALIDGQKIINDNPQGLNNTSINLIKEINKKADEEILNSKTQLNADIKKIEQDNITNKKTAAECSQ